jgi:hypothetical protein
MLKELDKNWHKNHYIGGNFTHLRIKVLIRMLDKYNNEFDNKILTLFMKRYSRMLTNFLGLKKRCLRVNNLIKREK